LTVCGVKNISKPQTTIMRLKHWSIYLLCIVSFPSCKWMAECFPVYTGRVLSTSAGAPMEGATIQLINQNISVKTDSNGFFKLSTSGCFDAHLKILKEHYKPFEITFSNSSTSNSYKVKAESKFVEYDKPFNPNPEDKNSSVITGTWIKQNSESFSVLNNEHIYYLDTLKNTTEEINDIQNKERKKQFEKRIK
jgi:hypothetical protein